MNTINGISHKNFQALIFKNESEIANCYSRLSHNIGVLIQRIFLAIREKRWVTPHSLTKDIVSHVKSLEKQTLSLATLTSIRKSFDLVNGHMSDKAKKIALKEEFENAFAKVNKEILPCYSGKSPQAHKSGNSPRFQLFQDTIQVPADSMKVERKHSLHEEGTSMLSKDEANALLAFILGNKLLLSPETLGDCKNADTLKPPSNYSLTLGDLKMIFETCENIRHILLNPIESPIAEETLLPFIREGFELTIDPSTSLPQLLDSLPENESVQFFKSLSDSSRKWLVREMIKCAPDYYQQPANISEKLITFFSKVKAKNSLSDILTTFLDSEEGFDRSETLTAFFFLYFTFTPLDDREVNAILENESQEVIHAILQKTHSLRLSVFKSKLAIQAHFYLRCFDTFGDPKYLYKQLRGMEKVWRTNYLHILSASFQLQEKHLPSIFSSIKRLNSEENAQYLSNVLRCILRLQPRLTHAAFTIFFASFEVALITKAFEMLLKDIPNKTTLNLIFNTIPDHRPDIFLAINTLLKETEDMAFQISDE
ncbi:hypothetical protein PHSC3_001538 [Chlamydiales bacterium STE3]|nr:hypothetical protein PHSC3_001538 [Chlamydiales bacterium STE3]